MGLKISGFEGGIILQLNKNRSVTRRSSIDGELAYCELTITNLEACCHIRLPGEALNLPHPWT
jgi:hypothetical protein